MAIYEYTGSEIVEVQPSTFAALDLREREDVQRVLRENINSITPETETMVLAEEYCNWEDARRRIDLLCVDSEANLVVVELKRTETGGHMELQAIRYAAMVSAMKFEHAVEAHRTYLRALGRPVDQAETAIRTFLGKEDGPVAFTDKVRIVLASANFSREVTTSVLWLNAQGRLDIRCVQMRPIEFAGRTLFDIQQVIPLPEAAAYQIAIREKSIEQEAAGGDGRDFTRYDVIVAGKLFPNLPKRRFIYQMVAEALRLGLTPEAIGQAVPWRPTRLFIFAEGNVSGEEVARLNGKDPGRYFSSEEEVFRIAGRTYAFINQWGIRTEEAVKNLLALMPKNHGISYKVAN
ncbi:hypothetical protein [Polaromonas sp. JS666]|uniref:hypothetical protein n=1 Tax=Polaromonas sp. (strain JS666 / ATCC BAA-500) TaxID=296591 RepID=UPI000886BC86|nr:hypothetical protein [Polaromonas sp. JS666]SDM39338.1 hypothetical protein SAMN05720382_101200 [Polaromonas sp. JS666]